MNLLDNPSMLPPEAPARSQIQFSPYRVFSREEWAKLRADQMPCGRMRCPAVGGIIGVIRGAFKLRGSLVRD